MRVYYQNRGRNGKKDLKGYQYTESLLEMAFRLGNTSPVTVTSCGSHLLLKDESGRISAITFAFSNSFLFSKRSEVKKGVYKNAFEYTLM